MIISLTDILLTLCLNARLETGLIEKWLIEVKPQSQIPKLNENGQIIYPELNRSKKLTQKRIESWQEVCKVLQKNHEKWTQARLWCRKMGFKFKVISEQELALTYQPKKSK